MPCASLHLLTAGRLLREWEHRPGDAPFPQDSPRAREAFLHGVLAPDMGFVPGVDRFLSEIAHYYAPGVLTRALVRGARTEEELAFAWGWAAHVLGDIELHPLVGRAVGERLYGDRERRVDAAEDVATHVGVEVGLDMVVLARYTQTPPPPAAPYLREGAREHLAAALDEVTRLRWDRERLTEMHGRAVNLTRHWPRALGLLGLGRPRVLDHAPRSAGKLPVRGLLWLLRRKADRGTALHGFVTPVRPPGWMLDQVEVEIRGFPERFQEWVRRGPDGIEDRNLETGQEAGAGRGHPASDETAKKLHLRQAVGEPV